MQKRRAHADPVSCQSCRKKKLRCNKVRPCSNCVTRRIDCEFLVSPSKRADEESDLLRRVEKLEAFLPGKGDENTQVAGSQAHTSASFSEEIAGTQQHHIFQEEIQELDQVPGMLESFSTSAQSPINLTIKSTLDILSDYRTCSAATTGVIDVNLPTYQAALALIENYQKNVDHVCRIVHLPTLRSLMAKVYLRLALNEIVPPEQAPLFLSIFSLSAFFYQKHDSLATSEEDLIELCKIWGHAALSILDSCSDDSGAGTLEEIQATILMTYVVHHVDGFTKRGRHLKTMAMAKLRDLCIFELDAERQQVRTSQSRMIEAEVKRRVFWHVASSDWLESTISGPREGVYFINPSHIHVDYPRDCNDDDLLLDTNEISQVQDAPTSMAFFLARLELAHVCRQWTDGLHQGHSGRSDFHKNALIVDKQLEGFLSSLPFYLRHDADSRRRTQPYETVCPQITTMRYCILTATHSRCCRLHMKFFTRNDSGPELTYSRKKCLTSARTLIELHNDRVVPGDLSHVGTAKMAMAVHYTHLALVILVMDLCLNEQDAYSERIHELRSIFEMLERDRHVSPHLSRSLDALYKVLRKYGVGLSNERSTTEDTVQSVLRSPDSGYVAEAANDDWHPDVVPESPIDDFWRTALAADFEFDSTAWDTLFLAVDTWPI